MMQKKRALILVIPILILSLFTEQFVYAEHGTDQSSEHDYPSELIEELVEVRTEADYKDEDFEMVQEMINDLDKIPDEMLEFVLDQSGRIYFIDFPIYELEHFRSYKLYEDEFDPESDNWNGIIGSALSQTAAVLMKSFAEQGRFKYDLHLDERADPSVSVHEFFHLLDFNVKNGIEGERPSESDEFIDIKNEEYQSFGVRTATLKDEKEYFASAFTHYYFGDDLKKHLEETAPKTVQYIESFYSRILFAEHDRNSEVKLNWQGNEDVSEYEVYRNEELVDRTEDDHYTDRAYEEHEKHIYKIVGIDDSGDEIYHSFVKEIRAGGNDNFVIENDEITLTEESGAIKLEWEAAEEVEQYNVYRNDEKIAEIEETTYIDEDIDGQDEELSYHVEAISADGEKGIYKTASLQPKTSSNYAIIVSTIILIFIVLIGVFFILRFRTKK